MSTWHRAHIKFRYSSKGNQSNRVIANVTPQVCGNTESIALQTLRKMCSSWDYFVILELDWRS